MCLFVCSFVWRRYGMILCFQLMNIEDCKKMIIRLFMVAQAWRMLAKTCDYSSLVGCLCYASKAYLCLSLFVVSLVLLFNQGFLTACERKLTIKFFDITLIFFTHVHGAPSHSPPLLLLSMEFYPNFNMNFFYLIISSINKCGCVTSW